MHRRQWDVAGGCRPTCHVRRRLGASPNGPTPLPRHWSAWSPPHCCSNIDPCWFEPRDNVELPRIAGSTVIHLGGPNQPPNHHSNHGNRPTYHATASKGHQAPLDGKAVRWTVGQHPLSRSTPPASPLPLLLLQVPPYPLHTVKGAMVLGGDHHSSSSQAFHVFQALRSSPE